MSGFQYVNGSMVKGNSIIKSNETRQNTFQIQV